MAMITLEFTAGIDQVSSILENKTSFSDGSLVRFFQGARDRQPYLQKRGGWSQLSAQTIRGTARGMHAFFDLVSNAYIALGTEQALEIFNAGSITDITPIVTTTNLTNPFATTAGSSTVTVTDAGASPNVGDWVVIATAASVGGLFLQGEYQVTATLGGHRYQINAGTPAAATVAAGGSTFQFTTTNGSSVVTVSLAGLVLGLPGIPAPIEVFQAPPQSTLLDATTPWHPSNGFTLYVDLTAPAVIQGFTGTNYSAVSVGSFPNGMNVNMTFGAGDISFDIYNTTTICQIHDFQAGGIVQPNQTVRFFFDVGPTSAVVYQGIATGEAISPTTTYVSLPANVQGVFAGLLPPGYVVNTIGIWPLTGTAGALSAANRRSLEASGYFLAGTVPILIYVPTTVANLTLSGTQILTSPVTFNPGLGPANANATVSENNGQVQILYPLASLLDSNSTLGYGLGPYGAGPFGVGGNTPLGGQYAVRQWSLDNFGQILVAAPTAGALYQWIPPITYNNRATAVAGAPQFSTDLFVAMPQQQIISLGSDAGGSQDPMLVRFSDVGNFVGSSAWTASVTNQAGSYRLTKGARIIGGLQGDQQGFIWTDEGLWLQSYIGFPLVYSFTQVGHGCGLIAKRAAALVAGRLIWPGPSGFWELTGSGVVPVPCSVWDFLFGAGGLDAPWANNLHAFANSDFTEIEWYFPPTGTAGLPTKYVSYNLTTNAWSKGTKTITSGIDRSAAAAPTGADGANGLLQQHEVSTDANGQPMASFARTHWFTLGVGTDIAFVERLIHDFVYGTPSASVLITVFVADYPNSGENPLNPNDSPRSFGPFTASGAAQWLIVRAKGRLVQLLFDFSPIGSFARLGSMRAVASPAGRHP